MIRSAYLNASSTSSSARTILPEGSNPASTEAANCNRKVEGSPVGTVFLVTFLLPSTKALASCSRLGAGGFFRLGAILDQTKELRCEHKTDKKDSRPFPCEFETHSDNPSLIKQ